jgi:hypothetical protein
VQLDFIQLDLQLVGISHPPRQCHIVAAQGRHLGKTARERDGFELNMQVSTRMRTGAAFSDSMRYKDRPSSCDEMVIKRAVA